MFYRILIGFENVDSVSSLLLLSDVQSLKWRYQLTCPPDVHHHDGVSKWLNETVRMKITLILIQTEDYLHNACNANYLC